MGMGLLGVGVVAVMLSVTPLTSFSLGGLSWFSSSAPAVGGSVEAAAAPAAAPPLGLPPLIPHSAVGPDSCKYCHSGGRWGPQMPEAFETLSNDSCTTCHTFLR